MSNRQNTDATSQRDAGRQTVSNSLWSYLGFALGKLAAFVSTIVLARYLLPEEFGLIGLCLIAMQFFDVIGRFGLESALISRGERSEEDANTVFLLALAMALLVYGVAWIAAPLIAVFFQEDDVILLFRILALVMLIEALSLVHSGLLSARLQFRKKLAPAAGKSIVKGCVAITFAVQGSGVWALLYGQLAGAVFATLAFWLVCEWRPSWRFRSDSARSIMRFGGNIIGVELLGAIRSNIDYIFVGRFLGTGALGFYTIAYRLPELVIRSGNLATSNVAHPVMVGLRAEQNALREYYIGYIRIVSILTLPMGVGMACISETFVNVFYGMRWIEVIVPMQAISLALAVSSIGFAPGILYKAMNRPDILRNLSLLKLPFSVGGLWFSLRWGINGVAVAQLALAVLYVLIDCYAVGRFAKIPLSAVVPALAPAVLASCGMGLVVAPMAAYIELNDALELALTILIAIPVYILLVRLLSPTSFAQIFQFLTNSFSRSRRSA